MHAIVIRESADRNVIDGSTEHLEANVVPQVRQAPGIVSALWMTDRSGETFNVLIFEDEESASAALGRVRNAPRPDSMKLESVQLYRVLASF